MATSSSGSSVQVDRELLTLPAQQIADAAHTAKTADEGRHYELGSVSEHRSVLISTDYRRGWQGSDIEGQILRSAASNSRVPASAAASSNLSSGGTAPLYNPEASSAGQFSGSSDGVSEQAISNLLGSYCGVQRDRSMRDSGIQGSPHSTAIEMGRYQPLLSSWFADAGPLTIADTASRRSSSHPAHAAEQAGSSFGQNSLTNHLQLDSNQLKPKLSHGLELLAESSREFESLLPPRPARPNLREAPLIGKSYWTSSSAGPPETFSNNSLHSAGSFSACESLVGPSQQHRNSGSVVSDRSRATTVEPLVGALRSVTTTAHGGLLGVNISAALRMMNAEPTMKRSRSGHDVQVNIPPQPAPSQRLASNAGSVRTLYSSLQPSPARQVMNSSAALAPRGQQLANPHLMDAAPGPLSAAGVRVGMVRAAAGSPLPTGAQKGQQQPGTARSRAKPRRPGLYDWGSRIDHRGAKPPGRRGLRLSRLGPRSAASMRPVGPNRVWAASAKVTAQKQQHSTEASSSDSTVAGATVPAATPTCPVVYSRPALLTLLRRRTGPCFKTLPSAGLSMVAFHTQHNEFTNGVRSRHAATCIDQEASA